MFTVEMLPAKRGDCLWIEYGDAAGPNRILIDGGLAQTGNMIRRRLELLPEDQRRFELMVVTHIDLDHIGGILELLRGPAIAGLQIDDIWFNGWDELMKARDMASDAGVLGPKQAESVSWHIEERSLNHNKRFDGEPVMRMAEEVPPEKTLDGGMNLRILGPTPERLAALQREWKKKIEALGLIPGQAGEILEAPDEKPDVRGVLGGNKLAAFLATEFEEDDSKANGSSIALLLEYQGKRFLASGDAFAADLTDAAHRLAGVDGTSRLKVTAAKLSHHGGRKNTSTDLIGQLHCKHWLISTDGSTYQHPNGESLARVVRFAKPKNPTLHFNYNSKHNELWRDRSLQKTEKFASRSPEGRNEGWKVDLLEPD